VLLCYGNQAFLQFRILILTPLPGKRNFYALSTGGNSVRTAPCGG